jgi:hypothetical protein
VKLRTSSKLQSLGRTGSNSLDRTVTVWEYFERQYPTMASQRHASALTTSDYPVLGLQKPVIQQTSEEMTYRYA